MRSLTIGGYHQHRQDLRKLLCFSKICDPKSRQTSPTTNNAWYWYTKYLHRLHNDLPLLPSLERKAIANILSNSPKTTWNPHQTPPNVIIVPFEQRLHSDRGEVQTGEIKTIGNQGTFSKIQGNGQNDDEYIKETILDNEEVSAYTSTDLFRPNGPKSFVQIIFFGPNIWTNSLNDLDE